MNEINTSFNQWVKVKGIDSNIYEELEKDSKYKEILTHLNEIIIYNSNNPGFYYNVGLAYEGMNNWTEASKAYNMAYSLDKVFYHAAFKAACAETKIHNYEKAIDLFERIIDFIQALKMPQINSGENIDPECLQFWLYNRILYNVYFHYAIATKLTQPDISVKAYNKAYKMISLLCDELIDCSKETEDLIYDKGKLEYELGYWEKAEVTLTKISETSYYYHNSLKILAANALKLNKFHEVYNLYGKYLLSTDEHSYAELLIHLEYDTTLPFENDEQIFEYIISYLTNPQFSPQARYMCVYNFIEIIEKRGINLPEFLNNNTSLKDSVLFLTENEDILRLFIAEGANQSRLYNHNNLLYFANSTSKLQVLLEKGVEINNLNGANCTPLHYIIFRSEISRLEGSLEDPSTYFHMIEFLLKSGANVNIQNFFKETPFYITDNLSIIDLLLQFNPDLTLKNRKNKTAFEAAYDSNKLDKAFKLIKPGAFEGADFKMLQIAFTNIFKYKAMALGNAEGWIENDDALAEYFAMYQEQIEFLKNTMVNALPSTFPKINGFIQVLYDNYLRTLESIDAIVAGEIIGNTELSSFRFPLLAANYIILLKSPTNFINSDSILEATKSEFLRYSAGINYLSKVHNEIEIIGLSKFEESEFFLEIINSKDKLREFCLNNFNKSYSEIVNKSAGFFGIKILYALWENGNLNVDLAKKILLLEDYLPLWLWKKFDMENWELQIEDDRKLPKRKLGDSEFEICETISSESSPKRIRTGAIEEILNSNSDTSNTESEDSSSSETEFDSQSKAEAIEGLLELGGEWDAETTVNTDLIGDQDILMHENHL